MNELSTNLYNEIKSNTIRILISMIFAKSLKSDYDGI